MNKRTIVITVAAMVALLTALIFVWEKPSAVMAAATEPPLLFCCVYPTSCVVAGDVTQCKNSGGVPADWVGCLASDTTCNDSNEECLLGACCLPDGTCTIMVRCWCENVAGGVYNGAGTTCADVDDCIINGACCLPTASCIVTNQYNCEVNNGGTWRGEGTICGDFDQDGADDICQTLNVTCRSDIIEDGFVNVVDLLTLLADWGPCP